jgi:hypothetical protein
MATFQNEDLFPEARNPKGTYAINERCLVRTQDGYRVVIVSGVVLAQYAMRDPMAGAHAMVSLVDQGWADQNDVARAFACSVRTLRRYQRRFEDGGLAALGRTDGYLGLLDDAAPRFGSGTGIPRAGVLLALPALISGGVFECAQKIYGRLGPAFYGLRTSLLRLLLMALWRIKRPEGLKEHSPQDLGRVLGLDRAPEVKTLPRKLARLAAHGRAAEFGRALAQRRVAQRGAALGFLYLEGHLRVYHGQYRLPKAHVAQMRLSMPATSDYWVNDTAGDPLFVVTTEANAGLVKMLPSILQQVRLLLGQRRVTVVFDRGGYSPKLFQQILAADFDLLTYRKGRYPRIPQKCFREHRTRRDRRTITYVLADREVRLLKGKLRLPQVTRRMDNGHQTPILTSRRDLPAAQVAYRIWMVGPHYRRVNDEGRTLIQSALASAADSEVTDQELRVTLAPMSSAHKTRASAALCQELNQYEALFPGATLRLRYGIRQSA